MDVLDRLRWAVAFSEVDLTNRRPGDWLNLRDELREFLGMGGAFVRDGPRPARPIEMKQQREAIDLKDVGDVAVQPDSYPSKLSEKDFARLQADMKRLLVSFTPGGPPFSVLFEDLTVSMIPATGHVAHRVSGPLHQCALMLLIHLLRDNPSTPIRTCPDCGKLFLKQGKMIFCGRTCTDRAMQKRKRAGKSKPRKTKPVRKQRRSR